MLTNMLHCKDNSENFVESKKTPEIVFVKGLFFTKGSWNMYDSWNMHHHAVNMYDKQSDLTFSDFMRPFKMEAYRGFEYDAENDHKHKINDIAIIMHNQDDLLKLQYDVKECFELRSAYASQHPPIVCMDLTKFDFPVIYILSKKYLLYGSIEYLIQDYPKEEIDFFIESETKGMKKLYEDYRKSKNYIKKNFK